MANFTKEQEKELAKITKMASKGFIDSSFSWLYTSGLWDDDSTELSEFDLAKVICLLRGQVRLHIAFIEDASYPFSEEKCKETTINDIWLHNMTCSGSNEAIGIQTLADFRECQGYLINRDFGYRTIHSFVHKAIKLRGDKPVYLKHIFLASLVPDEAQRTEIVKNERRAQERKAKREAKKRGLGLTMPLRRT